MESKRDETEYRVGQTVYWTGESMVTGTVREVSGSRMAICYQPEGFMFAEICTACNKTGRMASDANPAHRWAPVHPFENDRTD